MALLFNREISWMAFNDRVLEEAQDKNYPLLERLKFIAIVSSNLDEFFMVRVAGLERKAKANANYKQEDGSKAQDTLYQIRELALEQKRKQAEVLKDVLMQLQKEGLFLQTDVTLEADLDIIDFFKKNFPQPKIQFFNNIADFKSLPSGHIYVFVKLKDRFAIVSMPEQSQRLILLPHGISKTKDHYILAERVLAAAAIHYFPNETIFEAFPFKIIRDADMKIAADVDPEELLPQIEAALQNRARLPAVRLEVDAPAISDGALALASGLKLELRSIYRYDLPLDLRILWRIHSHDGYDKLRFLKIEEDNTPKSIKLVPNLVKIMEGQDVLLHHPYDSFDTVVKLLESAAQDSNVVAIRQTLYRTGKDSAIVKALVDAAKAGKSVSVLVELRARFDEDTNIKLVKEFKKCGIKVLKGFPDKKIHCKVTQIVRRDGDDVTSFVHMGTGNYNPSTARSYTDLSLLTTHEGFGRDAEKLFKAFDGGRFPTVFENFVSAPEQLHKKITEWVRSEAQRAKDGDKSAHIIAKMNSLVDPAMVEELYAASQAGVKIDLIVRGACVLRPGVVGLSENINVISIVDKYLEHSRIYYFKNGEHPKIYLSSADWMPRSFHRRIEIAFPIEEDDLKNYMKDVVLQTYLKDNVKARTLLPDGRWVRKAVQAGDERFRAQEYFEKLAKTRYKGTTLYGRIVKQKTENLILGGNP